MPYENVRTWSSVLQCSEPRDMSLSNLGSSMVQMTTHMASRSARDGLETIQPIRMIWPGLSGITL